MTDLKILFATDVPFWHQSTGAEQRIFAMARYLTKQGCDCTVFYLGALDESDKTLVQNFGLNVQENSSDQPPDRLINRIRWYRDATIHQARSWLNRGDSTAETDGPGSLSLADFHWPWAVTRFRETVDSFKPDAIIFEYVKTAYLLDGLTDQQRNSICCLIDTHDVLHRRAEQFFANGFPHWLKIDRDEEASVLRRFDAVLAIQDQEAATFSEMAGTDTTVITVGHAVVFDDAEIETDTGPVPGKISVGYIGSKNFSNWHAIRNFLEFAWPHVMSEHEDKCELLVAGAICDWFDQDDQGRIDWETAVDSSDAKGGSATATSIGNVKLLGRVDRVESFYKSIDVMINPVHFGTGLKIKNAESLRFGKLLITTLNGFNGMPEATRLACKVVESVNEMGLAINSICSDLSQVRPMQQLAFQLAQTEFSESQAYSELSRFLNSRCRP